MLLEERSRQQQIFSNMKSERRWLIAHVKSSYFWTLFSRDAEVKRDEHVKDAGKLVTRATKYKDEAKREQKKVRKSENNWDLSDTQNGIYH